MRNLQLAFHCPFQRISFISLSLSLSLPLSLYAHSCMILHDFLAVNHGHQRAYALQAQHHHLQQHYERMRKRRSLGNSSLLTWCKPTCWAVANSHQLWQHNFCMREGWPVATRVICFPLFPWSLCFSKHHHLRCMHQLRGKSRGVAAWNSAIARHVKAQSWKDRCQLQRCYQCMWKGRTLGICCPNSRCRPQNALRAADEIDL